MNSEPTIHTFQAMNSHIELKLVCEDDVMGEAARLAEDWFAETESIFSRFRHDSELTGINRAGGEPVIISPMMMEVLQLAEAYRQKTEGICSPYLGQPLLDAGYTSSFEQLQTTRRLSEDRRSSLVTQVSGSVPQHSERPELQSLMLLDKGMVSVQLQAGIRLDLGGIVKSWTASRLARWLRTGSGIRTGLVNAGGDLVAWQPANEPPLWRIGIPKPYDDSSHEIAVRAVGRGAVATSGSWRRQWQLNGESRHHLIDPRTDQPAVSDVMQCSVAGPDLTECEVWAKTVCIAGEQLGVRLMNERAPQYEAVIVDRSGQVRIYGGGWQLV